MWYLFLQVWILLLIAFILGWFTHWFFCCRNKEQASDNVTVTNAVAASGSTTTTTVSEDTVTIDDAWKPQGFANRPDSTDDLKRIKGVGAVIEKTLNELGIYQFSQVADWDNDNIAWVENFISFPGRITREDWVNQSKTLNAGGTTEFAKRVDKGELNY